VQVPAIYVDAPVVQGDGWEQLKKGVGQTLGTVNPGERGNLVLSAHNDIFGEIFRELDQLNPGDLVIVHTNQRSYTYIVVDTRIVEPSAVEVMDQTPQALSLISCYPYLKITSASSNCPRKPADSKNWIGVLRMAKKSKRQVRKVAGNGSAIKPGVAVPQTSPVAGASSRMSSQEFNPDYSQTIKDLKRIGILASSFFVVLVIISFFLR
jgi:LPXTG-site transpeptidase (sortase) family protein